MQYINLHIPTHYLTDLYFVHYFLQIERTSTCTYAKTQMVQQQWIVEVIVSCYTFYSSAKSLSVVCPLHSYPSFSLGRRYFAFLFLKPR